MCPICVCTNATKKKILLFYYSETYALLHGQNTIMISRDRSNCQSFNKTNSGYPLSSRLTHIKTKPQCTHQLKQIKITLLIFINKYSIIIPLYLSASRVNNIK